MVRPIAMAVSILTMRARATWEAKRRPRVASLGCGRQAAVANTAA